jgi:hypothetical protein
MVVGVGTAGLGLKAALAALMKAVGTKAAGKAVAGSVIRPALGQVSRAAGQRMLQAGLTKGEIARSLGFDAAASAFYGLGMPGDLADKGIQLGSDTMLSVLPGIGGRFALGKRALNKVGGLSNPAWAAEIAGPIAGFGLGTPLVTNPILRAKDSLGGGLGETPYERMDRQYYEQLLAQLQQKYPGMTMQDLMGMG